MPVKTRDGQSGVSAGACRVDLLLPLGSVAQPICILPDQSVEQETTIVTTRLEAPLRDNDHLLGQREYRPNLGLGSTVMHSLMCHANNICIGRATSCRKTEMIMYQYEIID